MAELSGSRIDRCALPLEMSTVSDCTSATIEPNTFLRAANLFLLVPSGGLVLRKKLGG